MPSAEYLDTAAVPGAVPGGFGVLRRGWMGVRRDGRKTGKREGGMGRRPGSCVGEQTDWRKQRARKGPRTTPSPAPRPEDREDGSSWD